VPASVTPSAADFDINPRVEKHSFRGRVYTFTELTIAEYDDLVRTATTKDENTGVETLDDRLLMKLMTMKVVDVTPREYAKLGARVVFSLNAVVRAMHYNEEPDELKNAPPSEPGDDEKDKAAPGNA
jgi:hypothetical protein